MAKHRKRRARRNPTGTLLVNPRRGGKSRKVRRGKSKGFSLKGLLGRLAGRKNPSRRRSGGSKRRASKRRNPLIANPRHRRGKHRNPLLTNPRHRRSKRHGKRRNPLLTNPIRIRRRSHKRRNPARVLRMVQLQVSRLPLVGGLLGGAIGVLGSAIGGAIGVYPTAYAMPYVAKYIPSWLKPFAFTVAGAILSAVIRMLPSAVPYRDQLAIGIASAGGAVDAYRFRHGTSKDLGDLEGDDDLSDDETGDDDLSDDETGDDDLSDDDLSDDEIGNDGSPLAATEYADADLGDMEYMGDDFSDAEIAAAELGRKHYHKKFKKGKSSGPVAEGVSAHAGKPGLRQAALIYWIGFDNFKRLTQLPQKDRTEAIQHMKREAKLAIRKLLSEGTDTSVSNAEMAGLLVA